MEICYIILLFFDFVLFIVGGEFSEYWPIYLLFFIPACVFLAISLQCYKKFRKLQNEEGRKLTILAENTVAEAEEAAINNLVELKEDKEVVLSSEKIEKRSEEAPINGDRKIEKTSNEILPPKEKLDFEDEVRLASKIMPGFPSVMMGIPNAVLDLLWIKGGEYSNYSPALKDEPSLIDVELEIEQGDINDDEDIGYYPSYRNLSPKQRYKYLNWLKDISRPIPIGYVFIFYYGLERHLLYGKVELAFDMIVKLRKFHDNNSFNGYSADALLISALYHKKIDLIDKINLTKATPALAQFVVASLTGKLDAEHLIRNCKDVGFTNQRYIKSNPDLFKVALSNILKEKFGIPFYIVSEESFKKCSKTFPLVIANYSLNMNQRIANAPDITSNMDYCTEVLSLLKEAHEKVKEQKKESRIKSAGQ